MSKQKKDREPQDLPEKETPAAPDPSEQAPEAEEKQAEDNPSKKEQSSKDKKPEPKEPTELEQLTAKYDALNDRLMRTLAEADPAGKGRHVQRWPRQRGGTDCPRAGHL